ncbi:MAG: hypothetical protein ABI193_03140, partial [Minicystis sp.]
VWIVPSFGGARPRGATRISPESAAFRVEAWFPEGGRSRQLLAEIQEELGAPLLAEPGLSVERLRAAVCEGLRAGALEAFRVHLTLSGGAVQQAPEAPRDEAPATSEQKSWIGIELMDDADPPKPVAFEKYRIELPDASIREGMLDANGQARVTGIDPGSCKISFPRLHGDDWKRA